MQNRQPSGAPWPTDEDAIMVAWDSRTLTEHLARAKVHAKKWRNRLFLAMEKGWDLAEAMEVIHKQPHKHPDPKGCLSAQRRLSNNGYTS